ncbi:MAG: type II secretion system protein GspD, partial [Candidatus Syntropharchaeia archaeon]
FTPSAEIAVFSKLGYLVIIGREEDIETVEELLKLCVDKFKRIEEEKRKIAEKEKKPEKPEYVKVTNGKFSITADNVNLGELIKEIADKLNISIIFVNVPTESVSMKISNITWEDFKRITSKNYGYIFEEDPSGVVIVEKVKKEQETVTKRYIYRIPHNFEQIKSLVEFYGGTVYVDDLNNYMVITGIPESLRKELDKVIEEFSKPTKQVEIEVKVIDKKIADKILKDLSTTIQVPGYGSISFSSGAGGELNTNVGIIDAMDYEKFLEALTDILLDVTLTSKKSVDLSEILAAPKIVTVSGQEARIFIGNRVPYPVPTEEGYEIRYLDTGVDLEIKPFVRSDDTIELSIYTKVSDLADYSTPLGMMPGEVAREAQTNVIIKNGDTVIIGGLLREKKETNEAKLPFLSSIPIIGELFKYKKEETEKRNLLIFITAKVVEF